MAKSKPTKRKIEKVYEQTQKDTKELNRKDVPTTVPVLNNTLIKAPEILYDSDWINVAPLGDTLVEPIIGTEDTNILAYAEQINTAERTVQLGQLAPFSVSLALKQNIKLPERLLPFVKMAVIFDKHPEVNPRPIINDYAPWEYNNDPYIEVRGDGRILYKGLDFPRPSAEYLESELNEKGINSLKWSSIYEGKITWTDGADSIEIRNAWFDFISSRYDTNTIIAPDLTSREEYKEFDTNATEFVSPTSLKGTGTLTEVTWSYVMISGSAVWSSNTTITKNLNITVPLFDDTVTINYKKGAKYKNGVFQVGGGTGTVDSNTFPTLAISSTFHAHSKTSATDRYYHLWYSFKKARRFRMTNGNFSSSTSYQLSNIPITSDYQTETLPYSKITIKVNPDPYPEKQQTEADSIFSSTMNSPIWVNLQAYNPEESFDSQKHMLVMNGQYMFEGPARKEIPLSFPFVDEKWSVSGSTFARDAENRPEKILPSYVIEVENIRMRIILTLNNPNVYYDTFKAETRKSL